MDIDDMIENILGGNSSTNPQESNQESNQDSDEAQPKKAKKKRVQKRSKVNYTWYIDDIEKLIGEVEARPCIWDAGCGEYKDRYKRSSAWTEIAEIFENEISIDQLSAKWQNLRTQYRKSLTSNDKIKSGQAGGSSTPHWKFHSQMAFVGNAEQVQTADSESNMSFNDDNDSCSTTTSSAQRTKKNLPSTDNDEIMVKGMQCAMARLERAKQAPDEVQAFGNFLVAELRQIKDANYRSRTQRQLLQLLWDCKDKEPKVLICFLFTNYLLIYFLKSYFFSQTSFEDIPVVYIADNE